MHRQTGKGLLVFSRERLYKISSKLWCTAQSPWGLISGITLGIRGVNHWCDGFPFPSQLKGGYKLQEKRPTTSFFFFAPDLWESEQQAEWCVPANTATKLQNSCTSCKTQPMSNQINTFCIEPRPKPMCGSVLFSKRRNSHTCLLCVSYRSSTMISEYEQSLQGYAASQTECTFAYGAKLANCMDYLFTMGSLSALQKSHSDLIFFSSSELILCQSKCFDSSPREVLVRSFVTFSEGFVSRWSRSASNCSKRVWKRAADFHLTPMIDDFCLQLPLPRKKELGVFILKGNRDKQFAALFFSGPRAKHVGFMKLSTLSAYPVFLGFLFAIFFQAWKQRTLAPKHYKLALSLQFLLSEFWRAGFGNLGWKGIFAACWAGGNDKHDSNQRPGGLRWSASLFLSWANNSHGPWRKNKIQSSDAQRKLRPTIIHRQRDREAERTRSEFRSSEDHRSNEARLHNILAPRASFVYLNTSSKKVGAMNKLLSSELINQAFWLVAKATHKAQFLAQIPLNFCCANDRDGGSLFIWSCHCKLSDPASVSPTISSKQTVWIDAVNQILSLQLLIEPLHFSRQRGAQLFDGRASRSQPHLTFPKWCHVTWSLTCLLVSVTQL